MYELVSLEDRLISLCVAVKKSDVYIPDRRTVLITSAYTDNRSGVP